MLARVEVEKQNWLDIKSTAVLCPTFQWLNTTKNVYMSTAKRIYLSSDVLTCIVDTRGIDSMRKKEGNTNAVFFFSCYFLKYTQMSWKFQMLYNMLKTGKPGPDLIIHCKDNSNQKM